MPTQGRITPAGFARCVNYVTCVLFLRSLRFLHTFLYALPLRTFRSMESPTCKLYQTVERSLFQCPVNKTYDLPSKLSSHTIYK